MLRVQTGANRIQASGDNPAVIEDQKIAGVENLGQITEKIVLVRPRGAVEPQHAAAAANRRWRLGNQRFRQVEMEVDYAHSMSF